MDIILISVIALVALALIFDFTNGFHDAANSIAAIVATKTLPAKWAPLFAAFFNFIAYFIVGTAVADTVAKTVKHDYVSIAIIFAALFSAIAWNYFTWRVGMPSSSSHAILGGLIGAGIAAGGIEAIAWSSAQKAILGIVLSPVIAFSIAFIVMWAILLIQKIFKMRDSHPVFKGTQLVTSAAVSFGHGANDAQKTMGVIAALLLAAGYTVMDGSNVIVPECNSQVGCSRTTAVNGLAPGSFVKIVVNNTVGAGDTYNKLPTDVKSLTPNFTGYDNVTASSDASNVVVSQ